MLAKKTKVPDDLPERFKVWLDEVRLLITKEERETFLTIEKDYQRDAFIERFWKIRDPYPDTAGLDLSLEAYEHSAIERALEEAQGDVAAAARRLGIGRSTFYRKLTRYRGR